MSSSKTARRKRRQEARRKRDKAQRKTVTGGASAQNARSPPPHKRGHRKPPLQAMLQPRLDLRQFHARRRPLGLLEFRPRRLDRGPDVLQRPGGGQVRGQFRRVGAEEGPVVLVDFREGPQRVDDRVGVLQRLAGRRGRGRRCRSRRPCSRCRRRCPTACGASCRVPPRRACGRCGGRRRGRGRSRLRRTVSPPRRRGCRAVRRSSRTSAPWSAFPRRGCTGGHGRPASSAVSTGSCRRWASRARRGRGGSTSPPG